MIGLLIAVLLAALAVGCGAMQRSAANISGYSKVCVDGVSYLQFPSGATVQFDRAGKVVGC
jgi:hypothetical protein